MHREVSPLVRPRVFPLVPLHCHSLCLASTSSRGLGFVGIIPLSKNSAPNPDVCRSNLNLEGWRGGGGQSRAVTTPWPSLALPGWFPTASAPTAAPGAALIPGEGQDGCTGISIQGEAPEACLGGSWAGIWGAGRFGAEHTHCVLEICGHAHAQLHLVQGQVQLLTHLLPQGQQHLQGTRGQQRVTPGHSHASSVPGCHTS